MADKISPTKTRTSLSITDECHRLMNEIAALEGISRNAVIEKAVRMYATRLGVEIKPVPKEDA
jgi:predicted HicB family RNase H-like nuclease